MKEKEELLGTEKKVSKAGWGDKTHYSETFVLLIKRASLARLEGRNLEYYRCIDSLESALFKEHRNKVREYKKGLQEKNKIEQYKKIQEYIIDILSESGYLKYTSTIAVGGED